MIYQLYSKNDACRKEWRPYLHEQYYRKKSVKKKEKNVYRGDSNNTKMSKNYH